MGPIPDQPMSSPHSRRPPPRCVHLRLRLRLRPPGLALAPLAIVAALAGCGGSGGGGQRAATIPAQPTVTISVVPSRTSNQGRPLYVLIRAVTLKQFAEEPYPNVAQLVVGPDESVLSSFVVFPGVEQSITIDRPAKGALAVYFLFTGATGTSWKQLFDTPPSRIRFELGDDAIVPPGAAAARTGARASLDPSRKVECLGPDACLLQFGIPGADKYYQ
jgi:hypothetical protein